MEALKRELEKKRKAVQADFGGARYVKRAELEKKKLEQIRAEEEKEWLRRQQLQQELQQRKQKEQQTQKQQQQLDDKDGDEREETEGERVEKLDLPRHEVIRRLRMLKQPITLFGEDDKARLERLKHILRTGEAEADGELLEGQGNDFLRDIIELKKGGDLKKVKKGETEKASRRRTKGEGEKVGGGEGETVEESGDEKEEEQDEEEDVDSKRLKANFEELCTEDRILVFFKRLLKEWKQELDVRPEAERRTIRGKKDIATYKQCARYLEPMFKMCRRQHLNDDIRDALLYMVDKCRERDYLAATDKYIKLAIGNAPWPIGVTMVGIHERSAREKIHTNSVAHIMNDETTRKYLQSVKRLITFCQRRNPALPSKSVEFNSLANGSDLEALLQEEARKGGQGSQQALLRLTASKSQEEQDEEF